MENLYCDSFKKGQIILQKLLNKFSGNGCYDDNGELFAITGCNFWGTVTIESETNETPVRISVRDTSTQTGAEIMEYLEEIVNDSDIKIIDMYEFDNDLILRTIKNLKTNNN